jgi:hypothetical protein
MQCPETGSLRDWLERAELGLDVEGSSGNLSDHLRRCPACRAQLEDVRRNADVAAAAIGALAPHALPSPSATALARERLRRHQQGATAARAPLGQLAHTTRERTNMGTLTHILYRWRAAAAGLAAVLALAIFIATPVGQTAAAQFLAQFRSERFAVVTVRSDEGSGSGLQGFEDLGTVNTTEARPIEASTVAEAKQKVGFDVQVPSASALPAGVNTTPTVSVMGANEMRLTFDRAKIRDYLRRNGQSDADVPDEIHGTTLVVNVPPVVLLQYAGSGDDPMGVVVGQSGGLITADTEGGMTLEEVREFLLSLPGFSPETMRQLREIDDWQTTMPILLPTDQVEWKETSVAGQPALELGDNSGMGHGVLWQQDGHVFGVGGTLTGAEAMRVANDVAR